MTEPSVLRLNLLGAGYLLLVVGLGSQMWPQLIAEGPALEVMHGVALSMLCAIGLLAVLGLRHPLRMLPLLFFEARVGVLVAEHVYQAIHDLTANKTPYLELPCEAVFPQCA